MDEKKMISSLKALDYMEYNNVSDAASAVFQLRTAIIVLIEEVMNIKDEIDAMKNGIATTEDLEMLDKKVISMKADIISAFNGMGKIADDLHDSMKKED